MNIGIIGAGKVGIALGYVLKEQGFSVVAVASRRQASLDVALKYLGNDCTYTLRPERVPEVADVVLVTTQDREIRHVARQIFEAPGPLDGKVFIHTSGAHPSSELSPLEQRNALLGSLHPLQTFPDIDAGIAALSQTPIFIEGAEGALPTLASLASAVGSRWVRIKSEDKILYHLSAVFVCNLFASLLYAGEEIMTKIGAELKWFFPIIRTTLENMEKKGPLLSLTGPVVRGDVDTVTVHLEAMKGMELHTEVYKSLSRVAAMMAEKKGALTAGQTALLKALLEDEGPEKAPS